MWHGCISSLFFSGPSLSVSVSAQYCCFAEVDQLWALVADVERIVRYTTMHDARCSPSVEQQLYVARPALVAQCFHRCLPPQLPRHPSSPSTGKLPLFESTTCSPGPACWSRMLAAPTPTQITSCSQLRSPAPPNPPQSFRSPFLTAEQCSKSTVDTHFAVVLFRAFDRQAPLLLRLQTPC